MGNRERNTDALSRYANDDYCKFIIDSSMYLSEIVEADLSREDVAKIVYGMRDRARILSPDQQRGPWARDAPRIPRNGQNGTGNR